MQREAIFSACRNYRYSLQRTWDHRLPQCLFVGLNPSSADASFDDPTIKKLIYYCKRWKFGGFTICNLFAFRSADFNDLLSLNDPIGVLNDHYVMKQIESAKTTICMWGNNGNHLDQAAHILPFIKNPLCFQQNINGQPRHPLYLSKNAILQKLDSCLSRINS